MEHLIILGLILIILGIILRLTYKGNINYFFGYRTKLSMKNISNWNIANKTSSVYIIITGITSMFSGIFSYYLLPIKYQLNFTILTIIVGLVITIYITEKRLKDYDENNNF